VDEAIECLRKLGEPVPKKPSLWTRIKRFFHSLPCPADER
jgi:hypothetical protein